jgi:hypothetical protein
VIFVVTGAGTEAMVQLPEKLVEQVSLGLLVPVSAFLSALEIPFGSGRGFQSYHRPDRAAAGQTAVFDPPVRVHGLLAAGAGDEGGPSESLQPTGVTELSSVVADFGQYPGADQGADSGEAGDHSGIPGPVQNARLPRHP